MTMGRMCDRLAIVGAVSFLCANVAVADIALDHTGMARNLVAAIQSEDYESREFPSTRWRKAVPAAMRDYCAAVLAEVPRNSPRDQEWLQAERDANRLIHILRRPEYARSRLVEIFSDCIRDSNQILRAKDISEEVAGWIKLLRDVINPAGYGGFHDMFADAGMPMPKKEGAVDPRFGTWTLINLRDPIYEAMLKLLEKR
jgi:hypothetical protein